MLNQATNIKELVNEAFCVALHDSMAQDLPFSGLRNLDPGPGIGPPHNLYTEYRHSNKCMLRARFESTCSS